MPAVMSVFSKLHATTIHGQKAEDAVATYEIGTVEENKGYPAIGGVTTNNGTGEEEQQQVEGPDNGAQRGVHDIEAITLTWSKWTLIAVFLKYAFHKLLIDTIHVHPSNICSTASGYSTLSMLSKALFSAT